MTLTSDKQLVLFVNGTPIAVNIRVNKRAKRLIIKVDPTVPVVQITCPSRRSVNEGLNFAKERIHWIADRLAEMPPQRPFQPGALIPVQGVEHRIVHVPNQKRTVHAHNAPPEIRVAGDIRHLPRRVEDWLRRQARTEFCNMADTFCEKLSVRRKRITIRDTKSRWGSCSSDGGISLSWRLIMAPPHVSRYVVAHEVSHLKHMDHSPAFWDTVERLIDDRAAAQEWLSQFGNQLYGIGGGGVLVNLAAA